MYLLYKKAQRNLRDSLLFKKLFMKLEAIGKSAFDCMEYVVERCVLMVLTALF